MNPHSPPGVLVAELLAGDGPYLAAAEAFLACCCARCGRGVERVAGTARRFLLLPHLLGRERRRRGRGPLRPALAAPSILPGHRSRRRHDLPPRHEDRFDLHPAQAGHHDPGEVPFGEAGPAQPGGEADGGDGAPVHQHGVTANGGGVADGGRSQQERPMGRAG